MEDLTDMDTDILIKDGLLVIPKNGIYKASLSIKDGKVIGIFENSTGIHAREIIDAAGRYVLPGLIQPHAHLGRLEDFKDYATETSSAAIGGVTTVIVFHRAVDDYEISLPNVIRQAGRQSYIDFSFHLQVMADIHLEKIPHYFYQNGVSSFKFNMGYKGKESKQKGIIELNDGLMLDAFFKLQKLKGAVACVHCENNEINSYHSARLEKKGISDLKSWSNARPSWSEAEGIHRALYYSELARCPLYIVHMTTHAGLRLIQAHRHRNAAPVYTETCPQYLTHDIDCELGNVGKFIPPLRTAADREALWSGIDRGDIDTIGVDQNTRNIDAGELSIWQRPTSPRETATLLPVMVTEGFYRRGLSIEKIVEVTSYNAARIFNLYPRKGTIRVGGDADIAIVDMNLEKKVSRDVIQSASNFSVYEGRMLKGWPVLTINRGKIIMREGKIIGKPGWGTYIRRIPEVSQD